jgi:GT2 family glycosyltransferase
MRLSLLIISHNTRELTLACLRSVFEQTRGVSFEVIVVDNASADGSAAAIADEFPQMKLIRSATNLGFARANNLAAKRAEGRYLLLLNSDTEALEGAIEALVNFADRHPQAGIVGGRTFFADGCLNPTSCWRQPSLWSLLCLGTGLTSVFRRSRLFDPESYGRWGRDTARRVDIVSGCCLLIRRELWESLGGFDERFFMYAEDADLCLRAGELGYDCMICPEARLIHHGGRSERVREEKLVRLLTARTQLIRKHWPAHKAWIGTQLIRTWAATRMAALGLGSLCRACSRESYDTWRDVWRRRREWSVAPVRTGISSA